jgi:hypothetical protein
MTASGGIVVWIGAQTLYHAGGLFSPTLNQLSIFSDFELGNLSTYRLCSDAGWILIDPR